MSTQRSYSARRLLATSCYFILMGLLRTICGVIQMAITIVDPLSQVTLDIEVDTVAGEVNSRFGPSGLHPDERHRVVEMCSTRLSTTMRMQLLAVTLAAMTWDKTFRRDTPPRAGRRPQHRCDRATYARGRLVAPPPRTIAALELPD